MRRRFNLETEIVLAVMPTAAVIGVLIPLESFSTQHILFTSLASSAFLIYLEPDHPVNSIRTLILSQTSAALTGFLIYLIFGHGFLAASISVIVAITIMLLLHALHPPAVSTALIFAFETGKVNTLLLFFGAIILLVILIILQKTTMWLITKNLKNKKNKSPKKINLISDDLP